MMGKYLKNNNLSIECEKCKDWFHYECIGYKGSELEVGAIEFFCMNCDSGFPESLKKNNQ